MELEKLEQDGALQTIIYLYKVKEASKTLIRDNVGPVFDTLKDKTLPNLEDLGLVTLNKKEVFPFPHLYSLTPRGIKLAECILRIFNE